MLRDFANRCRKGRLPLCLPRLQTPRRRCEEAQDSKSQVSYWILILTTPTKSQNGHSKRERREKAHDQRGKVSIAPFQEIQACGQQKPPSSECISPSRGSKWTEWYACSRNERSDIVSARPASTAEHLRR